jgi:nitroreductase
MIGTGDHLELAAAANRAPSVHNVQPARFRFDDARTITLMENPARRLFVGDPAGSDNLKSIGAALEGLSLALSQRGLALEAAPAGGVHEIARLTISAGADPDALAPLAETRSSYRGVFAGRIDADHRAIAGIGARCPDLHIVEDADAISELARLYDAVNVEVVRNRDYRAELLSWMRLSRKHPHYARDGLNAEHMALSQFEAKAAGLVLGGAFGVLDAAGLAKLLLSDASRVKSAAGLALFHRPAGEAELETGRRFYRVWLEVERAGLALCPMSVLADVPHAASRLLNDYGLAQERKLVTVFRIGRRPAGARIVPRARLPATELIVA